MNTLVPVDHSEVRRIARLPRVAWLLVPACLLLIAFFLIPVFRLLVLSVQDNGTGAFTLENFHRILTTDVYIHVLATTLRISLLTALLCNLIGYPLAYWLAHMPREKRGKLMLLVMLPFLTSYLVKTFAWVIVLGRNGVINQFLATIGISKIPMLQSEFAVLLGMVQGLLPIAILTMLPVMLSIDERLVQAAKTLGAHPVRAFWLVYFRLSMPAIASAGLLTFLISLGFFIVPALLGGPRQTLLAQLIITQVQQVLDWGFAGALAVFLLMATIIACWLYDRVFGMSTLAGNTGVHIGRASMLRKLGVYCLGKLAYMFEQINAISARYIPRAVSSRLLMVYSIVVLSILCLPTFVVIPIAFTSSSFLEFPPPGFGLHWMAHYFTTGIWIEATLRSFYVAFITALLATLLGGFVALALSRMKTRLNGLLFNIFLVPMIVPRIIIAAGLMYLYGRIGLIGTNIGLIIGHTVIALPFVVVTLVSVLKGYEIRLDQAAATLGASPIKVLWKVTLPLLKEGLIAAFLFAFNASFDELTIALFVTGGTSETLPKKMWDEMFLQLSPMIAAASVIVLLVTLVLLTLSEKLRSDR
jgi:ABC-type spermidine/putrescine transport system permease subunit I